MWRGLIPLQNASDPRCLRFPVSSLNLAFFEWFAGDLGRKRMVINRKGGVRLSILRRIQELKTAAENAPKSLQLQIRAELAELEREARQIPEGR